MPLEDTWKESALTWFNQPGTLGSPVATTSRLGYQEWDVTSHVLAMLEGGVNHGWQIRDANESNDAEQQFHSREKGESMPELVITFAPAPAS